MTNPVAHRVVQAFYEAYVSRDPVRIAPFLADEVVWLIEGPIDVFPYCGLRHGKAAVIALFADHIPSVFDVRGFEPEELVIDGDRAAILCRLSGIQNGTGRIISYRCAQLVRFKDGKVVSFRSIIDSFDAAEQLIGHAIEVETDAEQFGETHLARQ